MLKPHIAMRNMRLQHCLIHAKYEASALNILPKGPDIWEYAVQSTKLSISRSRTYGRVKGEALSHKKAEGVFKAQSTSKVQQGRTPPLLLILREKVIHDRHILIRQLQLSFHADIPFVIQFNCFICVLSKVHFKFQGIYSFLLI